MVLKNPLILWTEFLDGNNRFVDNRSNKTSHHVLPYAQLG